MAMAQWEYQRYTIHNLRMHGQQGPYAVGLDGAEREVLRRNAHLGQHVEEGTLANIRKANNTDLQTG
jgi:hypothetical protein